MGIEIQKDRKGHKTHLKIQVFERRLKDQHDFKRFPVRTQKYINKWNIHFMPVMKVPVHEINTKQKLGQFIADYYYPSEFYIMAYRKPVRRKGTLRIKKYAYVEPFKIAFVKVMEVAGEERVWVKLLYPMRRYKWFWKGD